VYNSVDPRRVFLQLAPEDFHHLTLVFRIAGCFPKDADGRAATDRPLEDLCHFVPAC
jgi:hypothetical protein